MNNSICRHAQGQDPNTKKYLPLTGPAIQEHFTIKSSFNSIHAERLEKLKKMAEQAWPISGLTTPGLHTANISNPLGGAGVGGGASSSSNVSTSIQSNNLGTQGTGNAPSSIQSTSTIPVGQASSTTGTAMRPPAKSSGLFVSRKLSTGSSFLRSNAPKSIPTNSRCKSLHTLILILRLISFKYIYNEPFKTFFF
jgi:hypothetical protein